VDWIARETKLGNPALAAEVMSTGDPDLMQALAWSQAVNETIERFVRNVPPFPFVRQSLEKLTGKADMLVISATPNEALKREWEEHDIAGHVTAILGQESGSKKESLAVAAKYRPQHALMIGDAPGDHQAAVANHALFYPINPGAEEASWRRFHDEGIDKFLSLKFAGSYQEELLAEFNRYLPERPPWKVSAA
jgi:phosphoglycolate phosphatase-like HAD superfamily hydrolase